MKNANKFCLTPVFMFILLCSIFLSSCASSLPDYDFREEQFVGTEDYEAFLQTDEARAAFLTPDCESACKIVLLESTDFFRAVREGTLRLALQHPQRYLWMVPVYHGAQSAWQPVLFENGSFYCHMFSLYSFDSQSYHHYNYLSERDELNTLLQENGLENPEFIAPFYGYGSWLYLEHQGTPYIFLYREEPLTTGLDGMTFYPLEQVRSTILMLGDREYHQEQRLSPYL